MQQTTIEKLPKEVSRIRKKLEYIESYLSSKGHLVGLRKYVSNSKCHTSYNKIDLAQLFYILMDEEILFFEENDERANRSKMQEFIKTHFTFSGDAGIQTPILEISKQFSEAKGFTYRDKQLAFLDKLLDILHQRRERIARK